MTTFQAKLSNLWPHADKALIDGIALSAPKTFRRFGLTSRLTVAHAMAQFSHECGAGREMVENINYSAGRAVEVWPSRFHNEADCYRKCDSWQGDPNFHTKLIDHVYGGRMGNRPYPSHDGSTYRGRGLAQTTGREGYARVSKATGLDCLSNPEFLIQAASALECGVADFVACGCLRYAKQDDIKMVTRRLNGGELGLMQRNSWLIKWKDALKDVPDSDLWEPAKPRTATKTALAGAAVAAGASAAVSGAGHSIFANTHQWPFLALVAVAIILAVGALVLHFKR